MLIHVSTRLQRKTRQTCNSFSLFPFQEVCLTYFALFYYFFYFWNVRGGGCTPRNPPLDSPMWLKHSVVITDRHIVVGYMLWKVYVVHAFLQSNFVVWKNEKKRKCYEWKFSMRQYIYLLSKIMYMDVQQLLRYDAI